MHLNHYQRQTRIEMAISALVFIALAIVYAAFAYGYIYAGRTIQPHAYIFVAISFIPFIGFLGFAVWAACIAICPPRYRR